MATEAPMFNVLDRQKGSLAEGRRGLLDRAVVFGEIYGRLTFN